MAGSDDPYNWSIDQLVYELCHNSQPKWLGCQAKRELMPAPDVFEKAIRDHLLDGETFMSMQLDNLANDLGLKAFGMRRNVYKIIMFYRSISKEYGHQIAADHVMPYLRGIESPQITSSHIFTHPASVTYGNQTPSQNYGSPRPSNVFLSTPAPPMIHDDHRHGANGIDLAAGEEVSGEWQAPEQADLAARAQNTSAQTEEKHTIESHLPVKEKKRVKPTLVSEIPDASIAAYDVGRSLQNNGQDVQPDGIELDLEFSLMRPDVVPQGKQQLALKTTRQLFLGQRRIKPQPQRRAGFLSRQVRKDVLRKSPLVSSIDLGDNPFLVGEEPSNSTESRGAAAAAALGSDLPLDLAELLEKYPPVEGDKGYVVFGESGDENEYDSDTWEEIQAEIAEKNQLASTSSVLSKEQVDTAIDQAIDDMTAEWRDKKLPKVQIKGYRLWNKATRNQSGAFYVKESEFWLNRFTSALIKLRSAINDDIWHKVAEVKAQSRSLEESVFQKEEHTYYLSVLRNDTPPPRPHPSILGRVRANDRLAVPEGEELLESDTEPTSDDGFIEDDTAEASLITHENSSSRLRLTDFFGARKLGFTAAGDLGQGKDAKAITQSKHAQYAAADTPARLATNSSDEDSDDQIRASGRRKRQSSSAKDAATTPSRKQPLPRKLVDMSDDSTDSGWGSDLDAHRLPKTRFRKKGTADAPIELSSSPTASEIFDRDASMGSVRTPSLNPTNDSTTKQDKSVSRNSSDLPSPLLGASSPRSLRDGPRLEEVEAIKAMDWDTIEDETDHRRALAKAIYECLGSDISLKLLAYVKKVRVLGGERACNILTGTLVQHGDHGTGSIEKVANRDQHLARYLGVLFLTYTHCSNCLDDSDLHQSMIDEAYDAAPSDHRRFYDTLHKILKLYCSYNEQKIKGKKRKIESLLNDDSDLIRTSEEPEEDESAEPGTRSAKKRKLKVLQSQEAESQQLDDRARVAAQEQRRAEMLKKLRELDDNTGEGVDSASQHAVTFNPGVPNIFLDPHIGKKVKPHQENGIQFMWRELAAGKGCLLAHTMGLGKTMQVISLLVTIAQASESPDPQIQHQVPENLRKSCTLILSPPTLVENWYDEILMWTPPGCNVLGEVRKVEAKMKITDRNHHIKTWARDGGILLMTYSLFKQTVAQKSDDSSGESNPSQLLAEKLTQKPNIVVADEAHNMKNPKSVLAKASKQFRTAARIGLTGSPLSNHLEEYHQMIDWVAPGYLGSLVQFKSKYSEPIKEGLYADSSKYERRVSARKLMVLKRDLEPKICRADISAIHKDMPHKAEFFITIPLTAIQRSAYTKYIQHMLNKHGGQGSYQQAQIWSWLGVLTLLLNHPSTFVRKLESGNKAKEVNVHKEVLSVREESTDTEDPLPDEVQIPEAQVSATGLSSEAVKDILNCFSTMAVQDLGELSHSYRSLLTARIVKESMRIQDKILIFSHSIPTLDYLEQLLKDLGCIYARIDGTVVMGSRQDTVKRFNREKDLQAMLISTRAGGLGLNLQGANRVIIYDFNFNPTWEEQAIGRAYRLGQHKPVFVYRFRAGGTFEETVYNTSIFKTQLFARVVDNCKPIRAANKKLSDYLFPPKVVEQAELDECAGKDPEILDRIIKEENCIRKVELTETFQQEDDEELTEEDLKQAEQEYQDEVLARTNPTKLAQIQRDRYNMQNAAMQTPTTSIQLQPSTSVGRGRPLTVQHSPMVGLPFLGDVENAISTGMSVNKPWAPAGTYDDMHVERERVSGRTASVPPGISQLDGAMDDEPIDGCKPQ